jgi:hypothetical protein
MDDAQNVRAKEDAQNVRAEEERQLKIAKEERQLNNLRARWAKNYRIANVVETQTNIDRRNITASPPGYSQLSTSPENDIFVVFFNTIITLGRRIACPCAPINVRMLNRLYKVDFGKDMPETATRLFANSEEMRVTLEPYLVETAMKMASILYSNTDEQVIGELMHVMTRVYITHPMAC